ncbi:MAG: hypothetical protein KGY70_04770 [Bacteroidales bacterium]|nr:hypothetical protein [Bacteroidales bacterium]
MKQVVSMHQAVGSHIATGKAVETQCLRLGDWGHGCTTERLHEGMRRRDK